MIDDATIKRVAEEAKFFRGSGITGGWVGKGNADNLSDDSVFSFARTIEQLARAEQREADARICENPFMLNHDAKGTARNLAHAIRASGKENSNE